MAPAPRHEFEARFTAIASSTRLPQIFRVGFPDLPEWARTFSWVPASGVCELARRLQLSADSRVLDVACGMGGPGQIAAAESGASVVGIDYAVPAVQKAAAVARNQKTIRAAYVAASGDAIPAASGVFDAVICIDALRFIPGFGLAEMHRVLRPGGRLGVTLWERPAEGDKPGLEDIRAVLSSANFDVEHVGRHDEWLAAQDAVYVAAHAARDEGETDPGVLAIAGEGDRVMGSLERGRRVMAVAAKR